MIWKWCVLYWIMIFWHGLDSNCVWTYEVISKVENNISVHVPTQTYSILQSSNTHPGHLMMVRIRVWSKFAMPVRNDEMPASWGTKGTVVLYRQQLEQPCLLAYIWINKLYLSTHLSQILLLQHAIQKYCNSSTMMPKHATVLFQEYHSIFSCESELSTVLHSFWTSIG